MIYYMMPDAPTLLKGGPFTLVEKISFKFEYKPPFRVQGGKNDKKLILNSGAKLNKIY